MLNVGSIKFPQIGYINQNKSFINKGLTSDVFVKNTKTVSFKSTEQAETSDFLKWAKDTDFVSKLSEIFANEDNLLGSGFLHSAYMIPDNDKYILRVPHYRIPSKIDAKNTEIKDTEDKKLNINIGQEVAKIVVQTESGAPYNIEVLKKQAGKSHGIAPSSTIFFPETSVLKPGELPYESVERKQKYAKSIHSVAKLPVEAYEKLIDDIKTATEMGYRFDHFNSNNLLIDEENNAINIIDMDKSSSYLDCGNILYALTNIDYFDVFASEYDGNPMPNEEVNEVFRDTVQIINKFTQAMKNKGEKFNENKHTCEFQRLFHSVPFTFFCRTPHYAEKWEVLEKKGLA